MARLWKREFYLIDIRHPQLDALSEHWALPAATAEWQRYRGTYSHGD